jgi:hypothetical protein
LPSENKPLTPITLSDVFVILGVEVECRRRLDILFSQLRSERPHRALAVDGVVEPISAKAGNGAVARMRGMRIDLQSDRKAGPTRPR